VFFLPCTLLYYCSLLGYLYCHDVLKLYTTSRVSWHRARHLLLRTRISKFINSSSIFSKLKYLITTFKPWIHHLNCIQTTPTHTQSFIKNIHNLTTFNNNIIFTPLRQNLKNNLYYIIKHEFKHLNNLISQSSTYP
jgi:hypothetical protein